MAKLSKSQIENIQSYSSDIKTITSFVDAVRQNPTMHIGHIQRDGFLNMIREIFHNATDEIMREKSPADTAWITLNENTCEVIIEDNGRGIPHDMIIQVFTNAYTSSNYTKEEGCGEYTAGVHGVGGKVTNALCEEFIVESYILGKAKRLRFVKGVPDKDGLHDIPCPDNRQGTMIMFKPDFEIMKNVDLSYLDVLELIKYTLPLTHIGTKFFFNAILKDGTTYNEVFVNEKGLGYYLETLTNKPYIQPIQFSDDNGTTKANIVVTYDAGDLDEVGIKSFSNFTTAIGSHVEAFKDAMDKYFKDYMNKIYLVQTNQKRKNKLVTNKTDILAGIRAVIDVAHIKPTFTGQSKDELSNEDMYHFVKKLTLKALDKWANENNADLIKLCKRFKDLTEIRQTQDVSKKKITVKYSDTISGKYPAKFEKPTGKSWEELFICEGDSAKGSFTDNRVNETQGVFPIRGKLINCFTNSMDKLLNNEEIKSIINIIGGGFGKNFDINKVKFKKVIIATDADIDGSHIANLLLIFFMVFMPQMIMEGRIYKVIPPLYGMKNGKNTRYFFNKLDYLKYLRDEFCKNYQMSYTKYDNQLSKAEVVKFLTINEDYLYEITKLASDTFADPKLLELIIMNRKLDNRKLISTIKQFPEYRFLNITEIRGCLALEGPVNKKMVTLFLDDRLYGRADKVQHILDRNENLFYKVNGQIMSIYDIMQIFESIKPKHLARFKGLGEMPYEELAKTTIYPTHHGGQRLLFRYTFEDAVREIEAMRAASINDKGELLEDLKVTRFEVLE